MSSTFSWFDAANKALIRGILESLIEQWPSGPRDFQVEACASVLEKKALILIASTAMGKTATFFTPLLVYKYLLASPRPEIPLQCPPKPVVLVVTPLVELGNAHAKEMEAFGIRAISVNSQTLAAAREGGRDLYKEIRSCEWSMVFLSAERLTSDEIGSILNDRTFRHNLVLLGIDEAHVLVPWSKDFRVAYRQMAQLRHRLPTHCAFAAVTATLTQKGIDDLCKELHLLPGSYHCLRTSIQRPNIRTVVTQLVHPITSTRFPDIQWVFQTGVKAVIYVESLDLQWRVASYGWRFYPLRQQHNAVRLWSSMTSPVYNQKTLDLFATSDETSVIVATIAFGMGMNVRNIQYSINLGVPDSLEGLVQQNGRAGRNLLMEAFGITYVPKSVLDSLRNDVNDLNTDNASAQTLRERALTFKRAKPTATPGSKRPREDPAQNLDPSLRGFLLSSVLELCLESDKNRSIGSPLYDPPATCAEAQRTLACGSCDPMWIGLLPRRHLPPIASPPPTSIPTHNPQSQTTPVPATIPILRQLDSIVTPSPSPDQSQAGSAPNQTMEQASPRLTKLTKAMQDNLALWLDDFAQRRWSLKDTPEARTAPHRRFWRGVSVPVIIDSFLAMDSYHDFCCVMTNWTYLEQDGRALFQKLLELKAEYARHAEQVRTIKAARSAATRARTKGVFDISNILTGIDVAYISQNSS